MCLHCPPAVTWSLPAIWNQQHQLPGFCEYLRHCLALGLVALPMCGCNMSLPRHTECSPTAMGDLSPYFTLWFWDICLVLPEGNQQFRLWDPYCALVKFIDVFFSFVDCEWGQPYVHRDFIVHLLELRYLRFLPTERISVLQCYLLLVFRLWLWTPWAPSHAGPHSPCYCLWFTISADWL